MTKKTQKRKTAKVPKPQVEKQPTQDEIFERRRSENQAPLTEMIARGKDETEAAVLFRIMTLLDEVHYRDDDPYYAKSISTKGRAKLNSLLWNAEQVLLWIAANEEDFGKLSPKNPHYNPMLAAEWKRLRFNALDVHITISNLQNGIETAIREKRLHPRSTRAKLLRKDAAKIGKLVDTAIEDKAQLFLTIGFALGLRAFKHGLQTQLDNMKPELIERYTIKKPEEAESVTVALTTFARDARAIIDKEMSLDDEGI